VSAGTRELVTMMPFSEGLLRQFPVASQMQLRTDVSIRGKEDVPAPFLRRDTRRELVGCEEICGGSCGD
jgi:hypothetical protein